MIKFNGNYKSEGSVDLYEQKFYYTVLRFSPEGEFKSYFYVSKNKLVLKDSGKYEIVNGMVHVHNSDKYRGVWKGSICENAIEFLGDAWDHDGNSYTFISDSEETFEILTFPKA